MLRRTYSTIVENSTREGWLYIDSVFPIQLARWDFRHYIGILRQESLLDTLQTRLEQLSPVYGFKPLELQPQRQDGGVFVRFSYSPPHNASDADNWSALQTALGEEIKKHGPLPTWFGMGSGHLWVVRGSPWKEDIMNHFASPILKVVFDGPEVQEQSLYELCRPYGRIRDMTPSGPVPAGMPRSTSITFQRVHSATIARNVIHGLEFPSLESTARTRLRTQYQRPLQAHAIRNWMSSHPKIMLPIVVFLLGTLTYTIFDPIRSLMVEAKMLDWFDYRKFKLYQWLRTTTLDRLIQKPTEPSIKSDQPEIWKERKEAENALRDYLADIPTTIAFLHGPQGSGKTSMVQLVLEQTGRSVLTIDCRKLHAAPSDLALVAELAAQTGYWPVFTFLNSMNSLLDLASVGLIGQKAGLSSSVPEQLKQILEVVQSALRGVSSSHHAVIQRQIRNQVHLESIRAQEAQKRQAILNGTWHDGRLDCVAGNGIISELGVGDEPFDPDNNGDGVRMPFSPSEIGQLGVQEKEKITRKQKTLEDLEAINALPIVVIRNFASNMGRATREEVLEVLAQWAATLAENHIAHVIVLSDNRENSKRLTKALPTKPLYSIALSDADSSSSLLFVKQKLQDAGIDIGISAQDVRYVERLGGRASDLESLIHKVRSGMKVDEAVEDIISRGVTELRKNAFGEDSEDSKSLPWSRYQAWKVLKTLSKTPEVGYYDILVDFPFKGDENALRSMEHAELITITTKEGRPAAIRPGKPIFRWVFERVVNDKAFAARQDLVYNEKQIADAETKIAAYEQELAVLVETMGKEQRRWWSLGRSACVERARAVGERLVVAQRKVEKLERRNVELKKVMMTLQ